MNWAILVECTSSFGLLYLNIPISFKHFLCPTNNAKHNPSISNFFSITWKETLIEWVPQPAKQKARTQSERNWCVGLSSSVVSVSPGRQLNTRLSHIMQAARLRVGGSGLPTMSNIWSSHLHNHHQYTGAKVRGKPYSEGVWKFAHEYGHFPEQIYGFYLIKDLMWHYTMYHTILIHCVSNPYGNQHHVLISCAVWL